jgi:FkbM family methyltransferase
MSILRVLLWPLRNRGSRAAAVAAPRAPAQLTLEDIENFDPVWRASDGTTQVTYSTPNRLIKWRVATLFTKEPETIAWIAGFQPGEVLLDVGANVGMYTIWAAKARGVRVFAFEPESQNFALLYKNIVLNDVMDLVTGYCSALSDEEAFSLLYLSDFSAGSSCHTFGESLDHNLRPREIGVGQGCISTTLDRLVAAGVLPVPQHIKMDVDGLEHKVLAGARRTLADPRVKSILVEVNTNLPEHRRIVEELGAAGFAHSADQVEAARVREGPFEGVANYVFRR